MENINKGFENNNALFITAAVGESMETYAFHLDIEGGPMVLRTVSSLSLSHSHSLSPSLSRLSF